MDFNKKLIRDLALQANPASKEIYESDNWEYNCAAWCAQELEKFAELIVRECAQYMYEHYPHSRYEINYMRKHMGDVDWNKPIGKHFGVEE